MVENNLVFGFDKLTIRDYATNIVQGILRAVGSIAITPTSEQVVNNKGIGKVWAIVAGAGSVEGTISVDENPIWLYKNFSDSKVVDNSGGGKATVSGIPGANIVFTGTGLVDVGSVIARCKVTAKDNTGATIRYTNLLETDKATDNLNFKILTATLTNGGTTDLIANKMSITISAGLDLNLGDEFYINVVQDGSGENGIATASIINTPPTLTLVATAKSTPETGKNAIIVYQAVPSTMPDGFTSGAFQEQEIPFMCKYDEAAGGYHSKFKSEQQA